MANTIPACSAILWHHSWYAPCIYSNYSNNINLHYLLHVTVQYILLIICSFFHSRGAAGSHLLVKYQNVQQESEERIAVRCAEDRGISVQLQLQVAERHTDQEHCRTCQDHEAQEPT